MKRVEVRVGATGGEQEHVSTTTVIGTEIVTTNMDLLVTKVANTS